MEEFDRQELIDSDVPAIVIDSGTVQSRIGFSRDSCPKAVESTAVAWAKQTDGTASTSSHIRVGNEAMSAPRNDFRVKFPMEWGVVVNFDDMEHLWRHMIYDVMSAKPEEHPMVFVEGPLLPLVTREKTAQILFESFDVPALCVVTSSEASLATAGNRRTGMVVELGGGNFVPAPVVDGYTLRHKVPKTMGSGRELTYFMLGLLNKGDQLDYNQSSVANQIKEQLCYVAEDYHKELETFSYQDERLFSPTTDNSSSVSVGKERFVCPEAIFQPDLNGQEMPGLHEIVDRCLRSADPDLQEELFGNIVLTGGSALFPGLAHRLESELKALAGPRRRVQVIPSSEPYPAFKGAVLLSQKEEFKHRYLTKAFYDECGPHWVVRQSL